MKKNTLLKKVTFLFCAFSFLIYQSTYSQCNNPVPSGNSAQPFCAIDQNTVADLVTVESTVSWYDAPSGGNILNNSTNLQDDTIYYADNNANGGCSPSRFAVTVTIDGFPPVTYPIEVRCAKNQETIASLRAEGTDIKWYDQETGGTLLDPTHILEDETIYWAEQTENGCISARSSASVLLIAAPTPTIQESQSFCSKPEPTVVDLVATDIEPGSTLEWYDSETSETPLSPTTALIAGRSYWASVINTIGCESAARIVTTVSIDTAPNAGSNGVYPNCEIDSNVNLFDLLGNNEDNLPPDQTGVWTGPSDLSNGYLGTYDPFLNFEGVYTYTVKSSLGVCDDAISTVKIELVTPPVAAEDQLFCEIDDPTVANLQADGINLKWYPDNNATSTPLDSADPLSETDYWVTQTDENGCESSPRVKVSVTINAPLAPTTTDPNLTFCEIENKTVADLVAIGDNIKWYNTQTDTTALNETDLLTSGSYWATQTDNDGCESKNRLEVVVTTNTTLPPTTTNPDQSFCLNDFTPNKPTISDLEITGNAIKWYDTETSTTELNTTDELADGDYWATQTDTATGCESKLRLQINVTLLDPADATTSEPNQTFCFVDKPTVSDIIVTGDTIIWYDSETSTTPLDANYALADGVSYWALNTLDGCESINRLEISVSIVDPAPPVISEPTQTFCGSDFPTISSLAPTENITWFNSSDWETDTTPLEATSLLEDGKMYWAALIDTTTGCISSVRESVAVSLFFPQPPTTTSPTQTFCEIEEATIAQLNVTGDDIVWYDGETSTTPLATNLNLIDGTIYWAAQNTDVSGCESERLPITVVVNTTLPPTGEENQSFCLSDAPTIASLNISGTTIIWYASENSSAPLNTTDALINGTSYYASQTDNVTGCESKLRLIITATILSVPDATTDDANPIFCLINNPTISDILINGDTIEWYDSEISTTPLASNLGLVDGQQYWALNTNPSTGCISLNRLMITVSITDPLPVIVDNPNQSFCISDFSTVSNLEPTSNVVWYNSEPNSDTTALQPSELLVDGEIYWAANVDPVTGCISTLRVSVSVSLYEPLPPTSADQSPIYCEIENKIIADLTITGTNIKWYDAEDSTTPLDVNQLLITGSYWASQTDIDGCESPKTEVNVTVNSTPSPAGEELQKFCKIDNNIISDLVISGNSIVWYESETSLAVLDPSELLVNGNIYWASQTDASTGCESKTRLQVMASLIDPLDATTDEPNQSFCLADNPTVSSIEVTGDTILWYATETSTQRLSSATPLEDNTSYWALNTDTETGCESSSRLMITVSIQDAAPPVINETDQTFCESDSPTVADLQAEGSVLWFSSETEMTPLNSTDLLIDGNQYWAATEDTSVGCLSSTRIAVNVTLTNPGVPVLAPNGNEFCIIDNPTIDDLNNNITPTGYNTILWFDSYPNTGIPLEPSRLLIDGQTYYAIQIDANGCSSMSPLEVTVDLNFCDKYEIELYDGFSPNGDGINDTFPVKHLRVLYPDFTIEFVNRWGATVYSGNNNKPDWNGRLHGDQEFVPSGVYYFIINFNKDDKKSIQNRLYLSR